MDVTGQLVLGVVSLEAREMAQLFRVLGTLAEDPNGVPSPCQADRGL